ncbi:MAG: purine-nucleoside phosphorylase, partial [Oscillospiraceae bacterium]
KGKEVSVQGSGMGIPSIAIYSHELYNFYAVENIIRIGSAGAISKKLKIGDIVLGMAASTNSNYPAQFDLPGTYAPTASYELLAKAVKSAEELGISYKVGNIFSSDSFYRESASFVEKWESMGILAVEMEAAGLYCNAASAGKNALCILTISDDPNTGEKTTAVQRQNTFTEMMEVALNML